MGNTRLNCKFVLLVIAALSLCLGSFFDGNTNVLAMGKKAPGKKYSAALVCENGFYVCAEGGGGSHLVANRNTKGPWETFTLVDLNGGELESGDLVHLISNEGYFVVAEGGGNGIVNANRNAAGEWEKFRIIKIRNNAHKPGETISDGNQIALQTPSGFYLTAEGGGDSEIVANRKKRGPWETFKLQLSD